MDRENVFSACIEYVKGLSDKALSGEPVFVSVGGSTSQRPAEFLVREVVQNVSFSDTVTSAMGGTRASGHYRVEFSVACEFDYQSDWHCSKTIGAKSPLQRTSKPDCITSLAFNKVLVNQPFLLMFID